MALADFTVALMCLRMPHDPLISCLPRTDAAFEEAAEGVRVPFPIYRRAAFRLCETKINPAEKCSPIMRTVL